MKKRFAIILAIILLSVSAAVTPVTAFAAIYGDNDFSITFFPSGNAPEEAVSVEVEGIVYIIRPDLDNAIVFDGHKSVGNVEIPQNVSYNGNSYPVCAIAEYAFSNSVIQSIKMPESIELIGDKAFSNCLSLTSCDFGNASAKIGNMTFSGCSALENFLQSANILYAGEKSLDDTQWFLSGNSELGIYLGKCLYSYSGEAVEFTAKNTTVSIASHVFENNTKLRSFSGTAIKQIGDAAFRGCTSLQTANFINNLEYIGNSAFDGCSSLTGNIVLPSLKYIGSAAFRNCGFTSAKIQSTLKNRLPSNLFANCTNLESVELTYLIDTIGSAAFSGCSALNSVQAPGIKNIEYNAFRNCELLADKTMFSTTESIATGAFDNTAIYAAENGKISRIGNALYKTEETVIGSLAVDNGIKTISPYSFYNLESINSLALPVSLTRLDATAFPKTSLANASIFVFSDSDNLYSDLKHLPGGTLYIREGKEVVNSGISVGTIKSISVETLPSKTEYKPNETFDPTGIKINLNTEINGENKSFDITTIGYTPEYSYDFSVSPTVTVNYCGYTTVLNVTVQSSIPGDLDASGKVNTDDLFIMRKYVSGIIEDDSLDIISADIDNSGKINTDDLLLLRKIIAGLIVIE